MNRRQLLQRIPLLASYPLLNSCAGGGGLGALASLIPNYLISSNMITQKLLPHFPFQKDFAGIGTINAINPKISMAPDINKVRIGLGVQAGLAQGLGKITGIPLLNQIAGSTHNGQCTLACGLRYDPSTRGIYLKDPVIEQLQLGQIPTQYTNNAQQLLNSFGPQI